MDFNFKRIKIGLIISKRVAEFKIEPNRLCKFFSCTEGDLDKMYNAESLDSEILLKWSKILEYDFFRVYSQHLILYSPSSKGGVKKSVANSQMPSFRKNIYTREVITFMLEMIENNEKTKSQIIEEYNIPKTTLYKWLGKYKK